MAKLSIEVEFGLNSTSVDLKTCIVTSKKWSLIICPDMVGRKKIWFL
jgi:hypothetical protein